VYDANERLCKTIEPETGATVQSYDAASNVLWRATGLNLPSTTSCDTTSVPEAKKKTTFGYDLLNRLTSTSYGDGRAGITRTYTPDGLPETITSNGTVWTNSYNNRRLLEKETLAYGRVDYPIGRTYDANGFLAKLTYPDNAAVVYNPNGLGEPRQVGSYATGISYHPNGAIASFRYGNAILHTLQQNARGLPEVSQDAGIVKDTYTYDANGNVTSITDGQEGGLTNRDMDYDNLDRLLHVKAARLWGDAWYTYDALDNLVASRFTAGGTARDLTHTIDPLTNRLKSITNSAGSGYNFAFDYDDQGNIKQRGSQAFVFDMANRLTSSAGKGTYLYDGLGHRVSVVGTDGVNRIQVYSQAGQLLYVKASNAPTGTKYIHLHNHVVAEVTGNSVQYDHTDGLGSPVALTDATGKPISRTRYEPYGLTAAGATPVIGFTGHVNAPDIGLVYMQQRYYDPVAGRFLSIDPVTTDANTGSSFNRYAYADNSPYKYVDLDGRDAVDWVHGAFTAASFCPSLCGAAVSGVEGIVYLAEGKKGDAGIAFGAAAVGVVSDAGAAKVLAKIAKEGSEAARAGKVFTKRGKDVVKQENAAKNGGKTKCDNCGVETVPSQKSEKGVTPPGNETHVDHIEPKSKGGAGEPGNGQVLCRDCNLEKGNK
jgi:RHS repeat-associated protein